MHPTPIVAITLASTLSHLAKHLPVALRSTALVYVAQCIDCERRHTPAATQARAYSSAILADWHDGHVAGLLRCPACAVRYYQRDAATERRRYQDLFRSLAGLLNMSVDTEAQLEACVLQAVKASRFEPLAKEFERLYHAERQRAEKLHGVLEDVRRGRLMRCPACLGGGDGCSACASEGGNGLVWVPTEAREQDYAKALAISERDLATRMQERDAARTELQQLHERRRLALARGAERRQRYQKLRDENRSLLSQRTVAQIALAECAEATHLVDTPTPTSPEGRAEIVSAVRTLRKTADTSYRDAFLIAERDSMRSALDAIAELLWPSLTHRPDTLTEEGRAKVVQEVRFTVLARNNARTNALTADAETAVQRRRADDAERELQKAQEDRRTANELLTLATQENAALRAEVARLRGLTGDVVDAATEKMVDLALDQTQPPDLTPTEFRELDTIADDIAAHDQEAEEAAARAKWGLS